MKYFLTILFLAGLAVGCASRSVLEKSQIDEQDKELTVVAASFFKLQNSNTLPDLSDKEHGQVSFYRLTFELQKQNWFKPFISVTQNCNKIFVAYVEISGKKLMYFFCNDSAQPKLLDSFKFENGIWKKLDFAK